MRRPWLWVPICALFVAACSGSPSSGKGEPAGSVSEETSDGGGNHGGGDDGDDAGGSGTGAVDASAACDGGTTCGGKCVDTRSDASNCGRCGNACEAGVCSAGACIAPCTGASCTAVLDITNAYIDNVADFVIKGNTASWTVLAGDPPGEHGGSNEPTSVNGADWIPTFQCSGDPCTSTNTMPVPALPKRAQTVVLTQWGNGRGGDGSVKIVQQPTAPDYTLKLEFSDPPGGASHYHATITYSTQ